MLVEYIYIFFTFSLLIISCITKNMLSFLFLYTFIPIGGNHLWCMVDINFRFGIFFWFTFTILRYMLPSPDWFYIFMMTTLVFDRRVGYFFFFLSCLFSLGMRPVGDSLTWLSLSLSLINRVLLNGCPPWWKWKYGLPFSTHIFSILITGTQ